MGAFVSCSSEKVFQNYFACFVWCFAHSYCTYSDGLEMRFRGVFSFSLSTHPRFRSSKGFPSPCMYHVCSSSDSCGN